MSDEPIGPNQAVEAMKGYMAPLQAVLSDTIKTTADFGQLALKTCLTLNGGALLTYPTVLKIFTPKPAVKGFASVEHLFAFGTGCAAVGIMFAWLSAAWGSWMLSQIMVLPVLQTQKNVASQSMGIVQEKRLRRAEWSQKSGMTITWAAIGLTALIVLAGYVAAILGAWKAHASSRICPRIGRQKRASTETLAA